jgi:hypothetical protein
MIIILEAIATVHVGVLLSFRVICKDNTKVFHSFDNPVKLNSNLHNFTLPGTTTTTTTTKRNIYLNVLFYFWNLFLYFGNRRNHDYFCFCGCGVIVYQPQPTMQCRERRGGAFFIPPPFFRPFFS